VTIAREPSNKNAMVAIFIVAVVWELFSSQARVMKFDALAGDAERKMRTNLESGGPLEVILVVVRDEKKLLDDHQAESRPWWHVYIVATYCTAGDSDKTVQKHMRARNGAVMGLYWGCSKDRASSDLYSIPVVPSISWLATVPKWWR
jgi:hypothetical protein